MIFFNSKYSSLVSCTGETLHSVGARHKVRDSLKSLIPFAMEGFPQPAKTEFQGVFLQALLLDPPTFADTCMLYHTAGIPKSKFLQGPEDLASEYLPNSVPILSWGELSLRPRVIGDWQWTKSQNKKR